MKASKSIQKFKWLAPVALLAAGIAHAGEGHSGGNGGNSVVCFDSESIPTKIRTQFNNTIPDADIKHITLIEAYDLRQARQPRGLDGKVLELIPADPGSSGFDYAEKVAQRFDFILPGISSMIRDRINLYPQDHIVMQTQGVIKVDDAAEAGFIDAKKCVIATMAVQYEQGNLHFLNIDQRLFNHPKHSDLSRGVLLLHEMVYSYARNWAGQYNSRSTRDLIGYLIAKRPGFTVGEMKAVLKNTGILPDSVDRLNSEAGPLLARMLSHARSTLKNFEEQNKSAWDEVANSAKGVCHDLYLCASGYGREAGPALATAQLKAQSWIQSRTRAVAPELDQLVEKELEKVRAFAWPSQVKLQYELIARAYQAQLRKALEDTHPRKSSSDESFETSTYDVWVPVESGKALGINDTDTFAQDPEVKSNYGRPGVPPTYTVSYAITAYKGLKSELVEQNSYSPTQYYRWFGEKSDAVIIHSPKASFIDAVNQSVKFDSLTIDSFSL